MAGERDGTVYTMTETIRSERAGLVSTVEHALSRLESAMADNYDSLDEEWRSKYNALKAESERKRISLEETIKSLRAQVSSLEDDLKQSKSEQQASGVAAAQAKPAADNGFAGSDAGPAESADDLRQRLEKSRQRYEVVKGHLDTAVAVARTRKEQIVGWVKYADSLEVKIKKLEKRRGRHPTASALAPLTDPITASGTRGTTPNMPATPVTLEKPRALPLQAHAEVEKPTLSASFSSSAASFLGITAASDDEDAVPVPGAGGTGDNNDENGEQPDLPSRTFAAHDDGQSNEAAVESTQGDPSSDGSLPEFPTPRAAGPTATNKRSACVKEEPSSDSPEVVWERPAKRSRADDRSETPHVPPRTIKRERDAHEGVPLAAIAQPRESQESVDLDEGQLTVPTPRKRQLYLQRIASEGGSDGSASDDQSQERLAGLVPPPRSARARCASAAPLAPVSVNIRRGARDPVSIKKFLGRGIESVAEDGGGYNTPGGTPKQTAMEPPTSTGRASRLGSLLGARPAEPSPVVSASGRRSPARRQNLAALDSPLPRSFGLPPPPRVLPRMRDASSNSPSPRTPGAAASTAGSRSLTAALTAAKAESAARKSGPPLRSRPAEHLKMDDFKINPAANNGDTFAYNEVVRGRTDRASLAGCTDPQCCGKVFRGMATSELDAAGPAHVDRSESGALMERHLGDEAFRLAGMGAGEKRKLWVEARTKELADKYGKHRHRYHRRASPPGFWDTDFPTTQEEEYNRAEAEKVERITVQERHREAMRPGGRWLFRDE